MSRLTGKCIWITGASSGIGQALAQQLCAQGNFVIISGRREAALQAMILSAKGKMAAVPVDLAEGQQALAQCSADLKELTDYLDMIICCAGVCEYEDNLRFDPEMYRRVFEVNFLGVIKTLHLAMPLLRASENRAHIVAIGSLSSTVGFPRAQAYGASKAALEYFMRAMRADMVHLPLDTTLVRPGFVATSLSADNDFPMPFLMTPEQAAARIVSGLERRKRVIDFPRRLSWPLRLAGLLFPLWCRWAAPKISRLPRSAWAKTPGR